MPSTEWSTDVDIVQRPAIQIVGIQIEGPTDDLEGPIAEAWAELEGRVDAIIGRTGEALLQLRTELGDGRSRVLVGAQVEAGSPPPPDMAAELVYEARWIHEVHQGSLDDLSAAYARLVEHAADEGVHADGVMMTVGHGADSTHDLYLRLG
jgi:predicted transcriptional regulator YdeE